jgi:hypothetical protein
MPLDTYVEHSPKNPINQDDCIEFEPTELDLLSDEIDKLKYELFRSRTSAKFWKANYENTLKAVIELKALLEVSAPKQDFLINKLTAIIKE